MDILDLLFHAALYGFIYDVFKALLRLGMSYIIKPKPQPQKKGISSILDLLGKGDAKNELVTSIFSKLMGDLPKKEKEEEIEDLKDL